MRSDEISDEEKDVFVKNDPEFPSVLITYQHYHQSYKLMWYRISKRCLFKGFRWCIGLHGGIHFDPVLNVKEVVTWSICMLFHFWSTRIWTWPNLFEFLLLVHFETVRNFTFDPVRTNKDGSKVNIWTVYQSWIIRNFLFNPLSLVRTRSKQKGLPP